MATPSPMVIYDANWSMGNQRDPEHGVVRWQAGARVFNDGLWKAQVTA